MNRGEFAREVFKRLSIPINGKTLTFAVAWAAFEDTKALNNPWATTMPSPGATEFNSVGVKNYRTWEQGVSATEDTLRLGYYTNLVEGLRREVSTPRQLLGLLNASPWGSHPDDKLFILVEQHYKAFNQEVPGSTTTPKEALVMTDENTETVDNPTEDTLEARLAKLVEVSSTAVDIAKDSTAEARRLLAQEAATVSPPTTEPVVEATTESSPETTTEDTLESRLAEQSVVETTPSLPDVSTVTTPTTIEPPRFNNVEVLDYLTKLRAEGTIDDATWTSFFQW